MLVDKYAIREKNKNIVLEQIVNHKNLSRAELSIITNLNKATVSDIVKELINNNLVFEKGIGESSSAGGRKPIFLEFNKNAGFVLGIDIGFNYISYLISFLNGEIIEEKIETDFFPNKNNIILYLKNLINYSTNKKIKNNFGLVGITIGINGIISKDKIIFTPYYDLDEMDLIYELKNFTSVPIFIENEANLIGLGETSFSKENLNLISISIHSGIGAGIIINGEIYYGVNGYSGEIGHTILIPSGKDCPCGNKGCLEQYCSEKALLENFQKIKNNSNLNFDNLINLYNNNDLETVVLINNLAFNLAIGINNIIANYSPNIIYLNSTNLYKISDLIEKINSNINNRVYKNIPIKNSSLGRRGILFGAISISIKNFLKINKLYLQSQI